MPFSKLGLHSTLIKAIEGQKYKQPYSIQEKAIPFILEGKDVLGIAKTGSGKTASYVLPLLMLEAKNKEDKSRNVSTLVMVPTRELAVQVKEVFQTLGAFLPNPVKAMAVFGGVSINPQMKNLYGVNVLVATPGRLIELVESKAIHLNTVKTLVLDEADKLLNLGFKEEMEKIFSLLPKKRQNLMFSATLNEQVDYINKLVLNQPEVVNVAPLVEKNAIELIDQVGYFVTEENKGPLLRHLIKTDDMQQVLIFVSSVFKADSLEFKLRKNNIDATSIHGKKSQGSRTDSLMKFKNKKLRVLVATDLLARGIDIEFLPYVVNYELPRSPKDFVHRIGRTGRAENPGKAITFVTPDDAHHFKVIQKKMKKRVDMIESEGLF
jgi:ATP-dependent RNA helicase RhlE|tara:strand:- start:1288 stop:2424 length:1137 start_codon:yes stop_codon:yes gene_type:complete